MSLDHKLNSLISNIKHHNYMTAVEYGVSQADPLPRGGSKRQKQPQQQSEKRLKHLLKSENSYTDEKATILSPPYVETIDGAKKEKFDTFGTGHFNNGRNFNN